MINNKQLEEKVHSALCQRWSHLYIGGNPDMTKKQPSNFEEEFERTKDKLTIKELVKKIRQIEEIKMNDVINLYAETNNNLNINSKLIDVIKLLKEQP